MSSLYMHRSCRGFSLKELAIVLAVMGTLTGGILKLMVDMRGTSNANLFEQQVLLTVKQTRDFFTGRALPSTAAHASTTYNQAAMRGNGIYPAEMCPPNCVSGTVTNVYNVYGGTATFSLPTVVSTPVNNQMQFVFTNIRRKGCIQLAMRLSADPVRQGLISFAAGGSAITSFPISLATATTECASATANTITLVFRINK